ncbi:MAG: hypothetical protein OT477_07665 [Chloroflexi bacterium]|nr:hypothetical protein [Chloroflexota bacterium]
MDIFPTTTIVRPMIEIEIERRLPIAGEVLVREGQEVSAVQVVARAKQHRGVVAFAASEALGVPAAEVEKYLVAHEGTMVQKGDPLLVKKRGLGRATQIFAPTTGIITQVRHGYVLFERKPGLTELRAMVPGKVSAVIANWGVKVSTLGALVQGVWSSGREGTGGIRVLVKSAKGVPSTTDYYDARGAMVVAGHLDQIKSVEIGEEYGVRGFIVGTVSAEVYEAAKTFNIPIFVTDGVGNRPMNKLIFDLLRDHEGREASLLGRAQIGQRPQLIIPKLNDVPDVQEMPDNAALRRGQRVRLLTPPHIGRVGTVVGIYKRPRATAVGIHALGANVALPDGQIVFVPHENLDIII